LPRYLPFQILNYLAQRQLAQSLHELILMELLDLVVLPDLLGLCVEGFYHVDGREQLLLMLFHFPSGFIGLDV
jgi:hypothetical protein